MHTTIEARLTPAERFANLSWIPPVRLELLQDAYELIWIRRPKNPVRVLLSEPDWLRGRADPVEIASIGCRLSALDWVMYREDIGPWLIARTKNGVHVRDLEAFHRAAARAPLEMARAKDPFRFKVGDFLAVVLEEALPMGAG